MYVSGIQKIFYCFFFFLSREKSKKQLSKCEPSYFITFSQRLITYKCRFYKHLLLCRGKISTLFIIELFVPRRSSRLGNKWKFVGKRFGEYGGWDTISSIQVPLSCLPREVSETKLFLNSFWFITIDVSNSIVFLTSKNPLIRKIPRIVFKKKKKKNRQQLFGYLI